MLEAMMIAIETVFNVHSCADEWKQYGLTSKSGESIVGIIALQSDGFERLFNQLKYIKTNKLISNFYISVVAVVHRTTGREKVFCYFKCLWWMNSSQIIYCLENSGLVYQIKIYYLHFLESSIMRMIYIISIY